MANNKADNPEIVQPFWTHAQQLEKMPPCQAQCPNSGDIRGWLGIIAQHEKNGLSLDDAYDLAWEKLVDLNPFPATVGRICPHPCESRCTRDGKDGSVSVNAMERFLGDWGIKRGLSLPRSDGNRYGESIGVIGSGPASLSFAYQMARRGYPVTIYEKDPLPGGMLRHAIPDYRLPREVLDAEIQKILDLRISMVRGVEAGKEIPFEELKQRHQVMFLGMGAQSAKTLNIEGEKGPGVISGIEYLSQRKRGIDTRIGKRVVVIGGGNTAIDAARSARRDGAEVTIVYRRSLEEMPAAKHEVDDAVAENIELRFLAAPRKILRNGMVVTGVEIQNMRLGEADEHGRCKPVPVPGDIQTLEADTVLVAVSQEPAWLGLETKHNGSKWLHTREDGKLDDDLWAGGDDRGPGIASRAIAQGRLAAEAVHAELRGEPKPEGWKMRPAVETGSVKADYYAKQARGELPRRPQQQWLEQPELEVDTTITSEQALKEAARCMSCGLCFGCEQCFMYCNASGFTRNQEVGPGRYYVLSLDACEGCGKCIELCPCGYLEARDKTIW